MFKYTLSYLVWDPDRVAFVVPFTNYPIVWYGVLFAAGFLVTYFVLQEVFGVEILSKISLSESHVVSWDRLHKKMARYPHLFKQEGTLEDENRPAILAQIEKYIKTKVLPSSFYNSKVLSLSKISNILVDQMTAFIVFGIIIGARLGYVFFYGWPLYKDNLLDIFKIWTGGLASHGACAGILIALFLFVRKLSKTEMNFGYLYLMDFLAIISGFFAVFIRLGNFVNQEITGIPSQMPWAVIFLNPFDGGAPVPRHPVQLYEALFYLLVACTMYYLWKKNRMPIGHGLFAATFLISLFSFRFVIEFLKEPQGYVLPIFKGLRMGQYLSVPFILVGLALIARYYLKVKPQYKKSLP